jgi:membrane protein implicated in regulation of membrane protease activity
MTIFWASAAVLFLIIEAATVGIASIWFALGSLCALVAALLGAPLWLQIAWFIVISIATHKK